MFPYRRQRAATRADADPLPLLGVNRPSLSECFEHLLKDAI
jgi:hypothetical protein